MQQPSAYHNNDNNSNKKKYNGVKIDNTNDLTVKRNIIINTLDKTYVRLIFTYYCMSVYAHVKVPRSY